MTPAELVSSRGLLLQYSETIAAQALAGTAPNQYYEPGEPGDGTFVTLGCVKDVPNLANVQQEMAEHRCLDITEPFVAKFPTGFLMSEDTTVRIAFAKALYNTLDGFVKSHKHLTFRLKYAYLASETTPSQSVRTGYIQSLSDVVNSDGTEVDCTLTVSWSSLPKFTQGA